MKLSIKGEDSVAIYLEFMILGNVWEILVLIRKHFSECIIINVDVHSRFSRRSSFFMLHHKPHRFDSLHITRFPFPTLILRLTKDLVCLFVAVWCCVKTKDTWSSFRVNYLIENGLNKKDDREWNKVLHLLLKLKSCEKIVFFIPSEQFSPRSIWIWY